MTPAALLAMAAIQSALWAPIAPARDCRFGGAPWAARRGKKRWKRASLPLKHLPKD